jgi:hypothetical protein
LERHYYFAAVSALLSRALRRFAAFSWMIPRLAALSIAETSARTCSGLGVWVERTVFCIVRRPVTTLRLRSDRFIVWRARLAADFVFAIVIKKLMDLHAREPTAIVNREGFEVLIKMPPRKRRIRSKHGALQAFVQFKLRFLSLGSD